MNLIKAKPIAAAAVPLLIAVTLLGCQSTEKRKGGAENRSAGVKGTGAEPSIPAPAEGTAPVGAPAEGAPAEGAPGSGSAMSGVPEQTFDIDPTLLGFSYEDSTIGIRFSPPRSWPPLEPGLMEQTKQAYEKFPAAQQDDLFVSKPVRMFYEKDKRYFMILSTFADWPAPLEPVAKMEEYRQRVAARNPGSILHYGMTRHGKLILFQMVITNQIITNVRVVVIREGRTPIQVDYLVPQQAYPDVVKGIEASIGSIEPL